MTMKKSLPSPRIWRFSILLAVVLLISGCGFVATPTPEPVTLVFSYPEIDNAFYESLVPVFNQETPTISIE